MSQASGQSTARSKTSARQGKIHTANPELLKLLQESAVDPKKANQSKSQKSSPRKNPKGTQGVVKGNIKTSQTSENKQNLIDSAKKEDADSGHFEGEDYLISESGDAKVVSSSYQGKDSSRSPRKVGESGLAVGDSMNESNTKNASEPIPGEQGEPVTRDSETYNNNTQRDDNTTAVNQDISEESVKDKDQDKKPSEEEDKNQFILSDATESDCETLGSSSSELARLKSPSRKSLNPDFEGNSLPSSPVHPVQDDGDTVTPVEDRRNAGVTPHPSSLKPVSRTPTPTDKAEEQESVQLEAPTKTKPSSVYDYPYKRGGAAAKPNTTEPESVPVSVPDQAGDKAAESPSDKTPTNAEDTQTPTNAQNTDTIKPSAADGVHKPPTPQAVVAASPSGKTPLPTQTNPAPVFSGDSPRVSKSSFKPTPGASEIVTPRGSQSLTAVNPKLLEHSIDDPSLRLEDTSHPRFTAPYSTQRLKSRGDAAKRPGSVLTLRDSLDVHHEEETDTNIAADSLEIERDSLEVDEASKPENPDSSKGEDKEISVADEVPEQGVQDVERAAHLDTKPAEEDIKKAEIGEEAVQDVGTARNEAIVTNADDFETANERTEKLNVKPDYKRDRSNTVDSFRQNEISALSVNEQEKQLPAPFQDNPPVKEGEQTQSPLEEEVEFVLKVDPNKPVHSRYSSALGSGRYSNPPRKVSDSARGTPSATAAPSRRGSTRVTPSAKKVYVESPTFTKEEEEEYRFVRSRLDEVEEDRGETYRELDMATIQRQENYAALGGPRMAAEKRVRYSDIEGRYEDRDAGMRGGEGYSQASRDPARGVPNTYETFGGHNMGDSWEMEPPPGGRYEEDPRNHRQFQPAPPQQHSQPHPQQMRQQQQQQPVNDGGFEMLGIGNSDIKRQMYEHPQGYSNAPLQAPPQQGPGMNSQPGYGSQSQVQNYPDQPGLARQQFRPDANSSQPQGHGYANQYQQSPTQNPNHYQQPPPGYSQQLQHQQQEPPPPQPPQRQQLQQQQQQQPPVRGLTLPTGPSYDPADEEDLQRETTYQQGLRLRVEDGIKKAQEVTVPKVDMHQTVGQKRHPGQIYFEGQGNLQGQLVPHSQNFPRGQGYSQGQGYQDFVQDSLDYDTGEDTDRGFDGGFVQDSLEMYGRPPQYPLQQQQQQQQQFRPPPQNHFRNPPPLPQNFAGTNNNNHFQGRHLNNVNFDSEDYTDYADIRQQRVNPQIQPRFYNPAMDQNHGQDSYDSGATTERSDLYPVVQRYEDRQGDDQEEEPMEAVQPKPPKYDYINHNKEDYGRQHPRSYTRIHETTKEEKEKLSEIFIHPKPKSKGGILKKKGQDSRRASDADAHPPQGQYGQQGMELDPDLSPAEQVWAQRSANLAKGVDQKNARGRRRGPGTLKKFNSDSSLSQAPNQPRRQNYQGPPQQQQNQQQIQQQLQPVGQDQRAFLTEMPTPVNDGGYQNQIQQQVAQPFSPRPAEISLHPVTQQIVTEDGQRISVDVNLKLISPPPHPGAGGQQPQYYPQRQQQQPPPQYYGGGGRGRQYPAVTQYDEGDGMPSLDYNPQEQDIGNDNDYHYISPRERYSADEALRSLSDSKTGLNPYGKIPPIPKSRGSDHPSSAPIPDQGSSYMDMYRKQRVKEERPWYKVYGLRDYRKMQKEVKLGTLGPDLDSDAVRERKEKVSRQTDYAKVVMERNRNQLQSKKPPAFPRPKEENDILNKRKLAVEYSKSVPKPTVKIQPNEFNNYELASEKSPIAKHHRKGEETAMSGSNTNISPSPSQPRKKEKEMDILDLEKLRQRYEEDKQNEAIIRRNTGSSRRDKYY